MYNLPLEMIKFCYLLFRRNFFLNGRVNLFISDTVFTKLSLTYDHLFMSNSVYK